MLVLVLAGRSGYAARRQAFSVEREAGRIVSLRKPHAVALTC